jgi:hypothetical protein
VNPAGPGWCAQHLEHLQAQATAVLERLPGGASGSLVVLLALAEAVHRRS